MAIKLSEISNPKQLKRTLEKLQESSIKPEEVYAKLDSNQGAENAGKTLVVGENGNVVPKATIDGKGVFVMQVQNGDLILHQEYADNVQFVIGDDGYMRIKIN